MKNIIFMIEKLMPDHINLIKRRYDVLKTVEILQPVGRRSISVYLDITERTVRGDIEKLAEQELLNVSKVGLSITEREKKFFMILKNR